MRPSHGELFVSPHNMLKSMTYTYADVAKYVRELNRLFGWVVKLVSPACSS